MFVSTLALLLAAAPPPAAKTVSPKTAPAAEAAAKTLSFQPKTLVENGTLQVILGQRAVFKADAKGRPILETVEDGKLAAAHPQGAVKETYGAPGEGLIAAALDGSAEKRATVLKVWNGTDKPIGYNAIVLVLAKGGRLAPRPVKVCAVPAGGTRTETWPAPIVAIGLARFTPTLPDAACK